MDGDMLSRSGARAASSVDPIQLTDSVDSASEEDPADIDRHRLALLLRWDLGLLAQSLLNLVHVLQVALRIHHRVLDLIIVIRLLSLRFLRVDLLLQGLQRLFPRLLFLLDGF